MPRLFTAIEVPKTVASHLSLLRGGLIGARWIDAENYHITLRFIGDVDMVVAEEAAAGLARIHRPEFTLRFTGIAPLGTRKQHSIVATVEESRPLMELQAEQERIFQRIGIAPEARRYTPHVTLARLRGRHPYDIAEYLSVRGGFLADSFPVERFVLYSSRDSVGGGPYVVEEAYDLVPAVAERRRA
ncbi:MAG TPA: RNA 2',3'-cyclic phosphodiesterase [Bauldia sp.]|nr:RNA 2',3'-cyclic phosphodiesterase [Bauldia sp.]